MLVALSKKSKITKAEIVETIKRFVPQKASGVVEFLLNFNILTF